MPETRQLNVFLCHSSGDKPKVRELYKRLCAERWIAPWLDEEMLIPGMDWNLEIENALRKADVILFCLSAQSVSKEGYVQKEIKRALDIADEKPDGTIYDIPLRLEACEIPTRLSKKQWLDYYAEGAHEKLLKSLKIRAQGLGIESESKTPNAKPAAPVSISSAPASVSESDLDLHSFVKINVLGQKPFWIGKYPVTNAQYARFLQADDFANPQFWLGFPKFDENCQKIGNWGEEGLNWLREKLKDYEFFPPEMWKVEPEAWQDPDFGIARPDNPVVGVNFYEAHAYANWLLAHWSELPEAQVNSIRPKILRLPLETEWVAAAGGDKPEGRYPWDVPGKATTEITEITKRANIEASKTGHTTLVNQYLSGKSPHGVLDLAGNVWEWQANFYDKQGYPALRGGSWRNAADDAWVSSRGGEPPIGRGNDLGFRLLALPG
jgi:formylglycine-generating enzyme required for sulfatase activity